jgi:hypothetical protein
LTSLAKATTMRPSKPHFALPVFRLIKSNLDWISVVFQARLFFLVSVYRLGAD